MQLINTRIISHPMNWAIIMLMLIIGAMFGHLLLSFFDHEPATGSDDGAPQGLTVEQMEPNAQGYNMASMASSN